MTPVAVLRHPSSGRRLEVSGTQPGVQVYTANWMPEGGNGPFSQHNGIALETQHFPNAPNAPEWAPGVTLRPGEVYSQHTCYAFQLEGELQN